MEHLISLALWVVSGFELVTYSRNLRKYIFHCEIYCRYKLIYVKSWGIRARHTQHTVITYECSWLLTRLKRVVGQGSCGGDIAFNLSVDDMFAM